MGPDVSYRKKIKFRNKSFLAERNLLAESISWDLYPREIVKWGFWLKTTSFGALLWHASPFMQDQEVQRLRFHNLLHRLACTYRGSYNYSLSPGVWQSFVTIRSCNHLMRIISMYVDNTKKSEIS